MRRIWTVTEADLVDWTVTPAALERHAGTQAALGQADSARPD